MDARWREPTVEVLRWPDLITEEEEEKALSGLLEDDE
jgi:hypothetical protein